jgi:hypothetical protein
MPRVTLNLTRLSDNEYKLDNEFPVDLYCHTNEETYRVEPGKTLYFEDELQYKMQVVEDDHYHSSRWPVLVSKTIPCEDPEGRVIINFQNKLADFRNARLAELNADAEATRLAHVTPGAGMMMVYQQKQREADLFLAKPKIDPSSLPLLSAEAARDGVTLKEKVDQIDAQRQRWIMLCLAIEERRDTAKKAINAARTLRELDEASIVEWSDLRYPE